MACRSRHFLTSIFTALCAIQTISSDTPLIDSSALPLEHRSGFDSPQSPIYGAPPPLNERQLAAQNEITNGEDQWPLDASNNSPKITNLQVQCEKTHMRVNIEFDRPFHGLIFSKGYYSDTNCVHMKPATGQSTATFEIFLNSCGMSGSTNQFGSPTPSGSYVENTIIIQYDPYVQEISDQARKLRCTWYDFYEKQVSFRPFQVNMMHAVTANFLADNLQCWMQIQVGKGPWASEVSGIVKIGQPMTMVLAIKDDENRFDMFVRNCVAHDGQRAPIQLIDQNGCVMRPKMMNKFQKIKNFGPSASVVSFAYFQAFKFPDSMNVHFQCVIQVCRNNCPEPKCSHLASSGSEYNLPSSEYGAPSAGYPNLDDDNENSRSRSEDSLRGARRRRETLDISIASRVFKRSTHEMTNVNTSRVIQVVAPGDVDFALDNYEAAANNETAVVQARIVDRELICMSMPSFVGGLVSLLFVLVIASIAAALIFVRTRHFDRKGFATMSRRESLYHCN